MLKIRMVNFKTMLVLLAVVSSCCAGSVRPYKKKHHGLHHYRFLYYLTFLAIKLKIVFFLGTIFTVSLIAGKIIAFIKLSEYMKHKYHHHEEKIVYVNPHEHHDYGSYSGPSDFISSKAYPSYSPEYSLDQPPEGAYISDRYASDPTKSSGRNMEESFGNDIYGELVRMTNRLRQLNITDMTLNEMGIKDEHCKKKFVCKANYIAQENVVLRTGFDILSDASYQKYKPNGTITSEDECETLHQQCNDSKSTEQ